MNKFSFFSKHALQKWADFSKVAAEDVTVLLDNQGYINIGRVPGFNREHRLFYSDIDDAYYIAIQDFYTGRIVTILPIDYHDNISWEIHHDDLRAAKDKSENVKRFCGEPDYIIDNESYKNTIVNHKNKKYLVVAHYIDNDGIKKTKTILEIAARDYEHDLKRLIDNPLLEAEIKAAIIEKDLSSDSIWSVSIKPKNAPIPLVLDWVNGAIQI